MDKGDFTYRPRGASRPPETEGELDTDLFTDLSSRNARRTANSGRPDIYEHPNTVSRGRGGDDLFYGAYGSQASSRGAASDRGYERDPRSARGSSSPVFTEISWDSFMDGSYRTQQEPTRPALDPDPGWNAPAGGTSYVGGRTGRPPETAQSGYESALPQEDYIRYSQPQRPTARSSYRSAPAYRSDTARSASQRPPVRARSAPPVPPVRSAAPSSGSGPRRPRKRGLHPAFYVIALVLVALLVFGASRVVSGARNHTPRTTPVQYVPGSAVTPAPATPTPELTADPNAEPTPDVTPTPSPVPTPTPSGPKAKQDGSLVVPASWGVAVPERNKAVFDSFFDRSCMIGNSLVEGFRMWSGMLNIKCIYNTGAVVTNVIGFLDLAPITLNPGYYTDIYLMFGLNEVGTDVSSFIAGYQKLVDFIREYQPSANIYIISITPVTKDVDVNPNEVQTMARIDNFNASLKVFCEDNKCWYLDIYSMLLDSDGFLSSEYAYAGDGKHFEKSGYVAWANYMKTHYVDSSLLTE